MAEHDTRQALPPLPTCYSRFEHERGMPLYSADQMQAYAIAALAAQPVAGAVAPTADEVRRAAFELCEFIEDIKDKPTDSQEVERFKAGQRYAAKSIRRGLGIWFVDEENSRKTAQAAPAPEPSAPIDAFKLYAELRDLVAEAGAVDTLIGRPEVLRSRLSDLCKRVGQLTTDLPLGNAPAPVPSAQGEPLACDRDAPVCPWCDRQGWDICQHADDARTCGK